MVEAASREEAARVARSLADTVKNNLSL